MTNTEYLQALETKREKDLGELGQQHSSSQILSNDEYKELANKEYLKPKNQIFFDANDVNDEAEAMNLQ